MRIYNKTSKTILPSDTKVAESYLDQLLGLINPDNPRTLIFYTRYGIHTYFLKEDIGVLVLDSKNKVVKKSIVKPWHMFFWNPKYSTIIELPVYLAVKVKVGDVIELDSTT